MAALELQPCPMHVSGKTKRESQFESDKHEMYSEELWQLQTLSESCSDFNEDLPDHVRSTVGAEAFRMFVGALESTVPVVTAENMQDLFLLCEEFGLVGLHSQIPEFISAHSVADSEARKHISDLDAKNRQQERELCLQQKRLSTCRR
jgi:hypothetical protein